MAFQAQEHRCIQLCHEFYIDPLIDTAVYVLLAWCMQALRQHEVGDEDAVHQLQETVREHKQLSGGSAL